MFLKTLILNSINTNLNYKKLLKCLQKNQHFFSSVPEIVLLLICLKIFFYFMLLFLQLSLFLCIYFTDWSRVLMAEKLELNFKHFKAWESIQILSQGLIFKIENLCLNNICRKKPPKCRSGKHFKKSFNAVSLNLFLIKEIAFWRSWREVGGGHIYHLVLHYWPRLGLNASNWESSKFSRKRESKSTFRVGFLLKY